MNNATTVSVELQDALVCVLQYYALFEHPLTADEIYSNSPLRCSTVDIKETLESLVSSHDVFCYSGYYGTKPDVKKFYDQRKRNNALAEKQIDNAIDVARLIYKFPFVRFVGISGSLSKGCASENSDFDFFIVTAANRLWICRTLLHLFKKLTFVTGDQHKFCMNYFVDCDHVAMKDQNRYVAIELASLEPVAGVDIYNDLVDSNLWLNKFFPNGYRRVFDIKAESVKDNVFKRALESWINVFKPDLLNKQLMKLTDAKWRRKWAGKKYPLDEYDAAFKTTLHISKNHPANHQKRVLDKLPTHFRFAFDEVTVQPI